MKRILSTIAVLLIFVIQDWAQSPDKVSFQAVIRNASNELINNASIGMQISIHQGAPDGPIVYQERHTPISNQNGLVSLQIGDGTPLAGSIGDIHWESGIFFLQTETDTEGGTEYTISSTSQLLAVPYAFYATTSGSSLPGPAGPQGQPGAKGEKGDPGPQGLQGEAGPQGLQGEKGDAGPAGMQGLQGDTGPQGAKGDKGDIGAVGPKGDKGDAGPGGAQGLQGDTGPQGAKGDKGDTGAVGPKGDKGDVGPGGAQGLQGDTGPQGAKGDKGDTGAVGPKGDKGDTGPAGVQGLQGDTGPQGAKGDKGDMGPAGAQGLQGDTGPQGVKGDKGDTGAVGPKGDKGDQGDSFWKTNAKGIHYDQGNLGIGTAVPNTRLQVEWGGEQADVLSFVEGGLQRFAIEGHTASTPDRMTFKIRGVQALTLYEGGAVGIGTLIPNSSALLDLSSTSKGLLLPRMTTAQRNNIVSPVQGLLVFDNNTQSFWYRNATAWKELAGGGSSGSGGNSIQDADGNTKVETEKKPNEDRVRFALGDIETMVLSRNRDTSWSRLYFPNNNGNIVIGDSSMLSNFIGDPHENENNTLVGNSILLYNDSGFNNVAMGNEAMRSNISGFSNVAIGRGAMKYNLRGYFNAALGYYALASNSTGSSNTGVGHLALRFNQTGQSNTAVGAEALNFLVEGFGNTAVGSSALKFNTASGNTAVGSSALSSNIGGKDNIAMGYRALTGNTTGEANLAIGNDAMSENTENSRNVAVGNESLQKNWRKFSDDNVAIGYRALKEHTQDRGNVAVGSNSLATNIVGTDNIGVGFYSLYGNEYGSSNVAIGGSALFKTKGLNNVALGGFAGYNNNGSGNVFLGNGAGYDESGSNKLYISNTTTKSPLIYGDFDIKYLQMNGNTKVNAELSATKLYVNTTNSPNLTEPFFVRARSTQGYVAHFYNEGISDLADGIKITIKNLTTNRENDYITFDDSNGTVGRIEGFHAATDWAPPSAIEDFGSFACYMYSLIGIPLTPIDVATAYAEAAAATACRDGGVIYQSGNGDYAEWLEKEDSTRDFVFGQVVGVRRRKISLTTEDAEQILVISMAPIVLGNMPKKDEHLYEKVAFLGQVPIWVRGLVQSGDYLIPSGYEDGTAIAVPEKQIELHQIGKIIGRAWSSGEKEDINIVNAGIGMRTPEIADLVNRRLNDLDRKIDRLEAILLQSQQSKN